MFQHHAQGASAAPYVSTAGSVYGAAGAAGASLASANTVSSVSAALSAATLLPDSYYGVASHGADSIFAPPRIQGPGQPGGIGRPPRRGGQGPGSPDAYSPGGNDADG